MRLGVTVLLAFLLVAGCSKGPAAEPTADPATPPTAPTPTSGPTASATPTAVVVVFTGEGIGPYVFGAKLSNMQTAGLLKELTQGTEPCAGMAYARGTGVYTDIHLFFSDGVLKGISNRSTTIATAAGAQTGDTLAELQSIYGTSGKKVLKEGTDDFAYLATTVPGQGIIFYFDENKKVHTMAAGVPQDLENGFQYDLDC